MEWLSKQMHNMKVKLQIVFVSMVLNVLVVVLSVCNQRLLGAIEWVYYLAAALAVLAAILILIAHKLPVRRT